MKKQGFTTKSLNIPFPKKDPHNSLQIPLYESVAYDFETSEQIEANFRGDYPAHVYSRASSPTVEYFEQKMRTLLDASGVLAVSSGMAAISNVMLAIVRPGENVISGNRLFGHTWALFTQTLADLGLEFRLTDLTDEQAIEGMIDENTRAIYFETVTNPQLDVADIDMLARIARKHNLVLVADSTITPPNVFNGGAFGVDVEVISATKHLSGGANCFGGVIVDHGRYDYRMNPGVAKYVEQYGENGFMARLRKNIYRNMGSSMSPHTARYLVQGLDILELRVEKCHRNCLQLGAFLEGHPSVKYVGYPGLKTDERYPLAEKYFKGIPGTIMNFDLESKEACYLFMDRLKVIRRATNLNDNKSLIIHPYATIYAEFPESERDRVGIRDTTLRLSVGIENHEDLISDVEQALK